MYCGQCGSPLAQGEYCSSCGHPRDHDESLTISSTAGSGPAREGIPVSVTWGPRLDRSPTLLLSNPRGLSQTEQTSKAKRAGWIVLGGILLIILLGGVLVWILPITHQDQLKGVDLDLYCQSLQSEIGTYNVREDAYSCKSNKSSRVIDQALATQACNQQHSHQGPLTAYTDDPSRPESVKCSSGPLRTDNPGLEMDKICQSLGEDYDDTAARGTTAWNWTCPPRPPQKIDPTQACIWQNSRIDAQAREISPGNFECYGLF